MYQANHEDVDQNCDVNTCVLIKCRGHQAAKLYSKAEDSSLSFPFVMHAGDLIHVSALLFKYMKCIVQTLVKKSRKTHMLQ